MELNEIEDFVGIVRQAGYSDTSRRLRSIWVAQYLRWPIHANRVCDCNHKPTSEDRSGSTFALPSRAQFLGESDEKLFRPADVAKAIRILIPDYFAYELCAPLSKPVGRLVDVVYGEDDAEIA
jgi:hypothetical protein